MANFQARVKVVQLYQFEHNLISFPLKPWNSKLLAYYCNIQDFMEIGFSLGITLTELSFLSG